MRHLAPFLFVAAVAHAQPAPVQSAVQVQQADRGISPPLWLIPPVPEVERPDFEPRRRPTAPSPVLPGGDPIRQRHVPIPSMPAPSQVFAGVGNGFTGPSGTYTVKVAPPDTNGDVGPNHYIQTVNTDFAIFSKSGTVLLGPVQVNTVFTGFTGGAGLCASTNDGDPVVLYDQQADRWFITQFGFTISGGQPVAPYYQCVAVSQTSDPTGAWYQYAFGPYKDSAGDAFNDYGKFGVWPDAYYATFNLFGASTSADVCAFDRQKMLTGAAATQQCVLLPNNFGLLPVDLDGPPPPSGSPGFILGMDSSNTDLDFWTFHVDWTNPANTSLSGPSLIPVAAFMPGCSGGGNCVPEPAGGQQLASLGDRLMYRLVYRNFGDHEVLLANHSVDTGTGNLGVRWYELRNATGKTLANAPPVVHQQGTYAPDSQSRWMASLAMDQVGNIAVGYSISSATTFPTINYTGRLVTDSLNTLQQESTLFASTGEQTGTLQRWGDYSMMGIDPSDDCTFWYTQEYIPDAGSFNWDTRIGAFKFPNCPANDFSISLTPGTQQLQTGQQVTLNVSTAVVAGSPGTITLSVGTLPSGVTAQLGATTVTPGQGTTLTLTASNTAALGAAAIAVTGQSGGHSHTATSTVTVFAPPTISFSAPTAGSTVGGTVNVTASTLNTSASASIQVTLDGAAFGSSTGTSFTKSWDTTQATQGAHTFAATVTDHGLVGNATLNVTVDNSDFILSLAPATAALSQGGTTALNVGSAIAQGSPGAIALTVTGLPTGVTGAFQATPLTPGQGTTLILSATATAPLGPFTATVSGLAGAKSHQASSTITVNNQPPITVSFTSPAAGSTVSGSATVAVTTTNASANASIQLSVDSTPLGTGTGTSFSHAWDTTTSPNGTHTLLATVTDGGNTASATLTVTVQNASLVVTITAPADGQTVSGRLTVTAQATPASAVSQIDISVADLSLIAGSGTTSPASVLIDTTRLSNGRHTLQATATDNSGGQSNSPLIHVTVQNGSGSDAGPGGSDGGTGNGNGSGGCHCGSADFGAPAGFLLLALLAVRRRRFT